MDEIIEEPTLAPLPAPEEGGMYLTEMAVYDLSRTGKWAKFLAIFGFIISGLLGVFALFVGTIFSTVGAMSHTPLPAAMGSVLTVVYLIIAAISFILNLFLYQFADRTITALIIKDKTLLERGIHRLQSYFKAIGIMLIVELGLIALGIICSVAIGALFHH